MQLAVPELARLVGDVTVGAPVKPLAVRLLRGDSGLTAVGEETNGQAFSNEGHFE